jgi:hypothetical protein
MEQEKRDVQKRNKLFLTVGVALLIPGNVVALQSSPVLKKPDDGLNHRMAVWVLTKQVPEEAPDNVYNPGEKLPASGKVATKRTVCAKEFKTDAEIEDFIKKAPVDIQKTMTVLDEDLAAGPYIQKARDEKK